MLKGVEMSLDQIMTTLASLGGVAAFFTVLVNILKTVGIIKDGQAVNVVTVLNFVGAGIIIVLQLLGKIDLLPIIDSTAGTIAQIAMLVFGLVWQLIVSKQTHEVLRGFPLIGKSFSADREKAFTLSAAVEMQRVKDYTK
jgi:hypothetical protein